MKYLSAGVLLVAGLLATSAAPASAAEGADLGIKIKGTTISWSDWAKPATVTVTNYGTTTPAAASISFDASDVTGPAGLWFSFGAQAGFGCALDTTVTVCELTADQIPGPGKSLDLDLWIYNNNMEPGDQGTLLAQVITDGDTDAANDTASAEVAMSGARGPDLRALAEDVTALGTGEPLQPGETSALSATVVNNGSEAANGIELQVTLPEQVTFAEQRDGCTYNAALSEATCALGAGVVLTNSQALGFTFPVTLSADATGPARLSGGVFAVTGTYSNLNALARATATLPVFATEVDPSQVTDEVDGSDNSDDFVALVG